jgi:tetratricopeptide (TPR) repeat protein
VKAVNKARARTVDALPKPSWSRMGAPIAVLVVALCAAYANSFHGPFIFDDAPSIVENPSIRSLEFPGVLTAPSSALTTTGRPVVNLSLAINYAVGGLSVEGYHVTNLALHLLAALALFALLRRTLLLPALSEKLGPAASELALVVALLWAVHPLQTESVTYVVQRAEALVGLFYFLTFYCFLRGATTAQNRGWYAAALTACVLGMASKEVMISAPFLLLFFDRTFIAGSFEESWRRRRGLWLALGATCLLPVLLLETTDNRDGSAGFGLGVTSWEYARTQFGFILHYLRLAFWPRPLVLDYGRYIASSPAEIVPSAIGVLVLLGATAVALVRRPKWGFLGAWFFGILAPTSSIIPLPGQTAAEHRMYLPLAAVVVSLVLAVYSVALERGWRSSWSRALVLVVAAALGWGTYRRNEDYQSELALWDGAVKNRPLNDRAYLTRGSVYWTMGQRAAALRDYDRCIALNPREAKAYVGRGNVYIDLGRHDDALRDYDTALRLHPNLADAHDGRGEVLAFKGQLDAAIEEFNRAIALNPGHAQAHYDLAEAYSATGALDDAIASYDRVIRLRADYANAYNSRGVAYDNKGQVDAAISDYDKAIALRPVFSGAYSNRCSARTVKGQLDAAIEDCNKAIELRPDFAEAYSNRGNALQNKGQLAAAIEAYDKAIALEPSSAMFYQNRAMAHARSRAYDQAWADLKMVRKLGGTPIPSFVEDLTKRSGRSE